MEDDIWSDLDARDFYSDLWGGGGYDWNGMPEYSSPPAQDYGYGGGYEDYSGNTGSGSGGYRIGDQWYDITAPGNNAPQTYTPGMVSSGVGYTPGGYSAADNWLASRQAAQRDSWNAFNATQVPSGMSGGGGGTPTARNASVSSRPYEMMSLGKPDREMYDLYTGMLKNPSQLDQNPAYQFLYNQGLQALNRSLAAKKMTLSGKGMNDTLSFGQGQAANFANQMLPQYRAGAQEELARFMGPAGLLPRYVAGNNATIGGARSEDLAAGGGGLDGMFSAGLPSAGGGSSFTGAGIGMGGVRSGYNPVSLPSSTPSYTPRLSQAYGEPSPYPTYDGYDIEGGPAYG